MTQLALLLACAAPDHLDTDGQELADLVVDDDGEASESPAAVEVAAPAPEQTRRSVVLVSVDSLRADHLGLYGSERDTSPQLDAWAELGVVYERYTSQAYWTVPSMSSLFASVYPATHLCCKFQADEFQELRGEPLADEFDLIAEVFEAAGYETGGLTKSESMELSGGFDQGFQHYERVDGYLNTETSAEEVTEAALDWLDDLEGDKPFLLWVHYMDPHTTYQAPSGWLGRYSDEHDSDLDGETVTISALDSGQVAYGDEDVAFVEALYDEEIAYWDSWFGQLLDEVDARSGLDNTVVVLVGDHGEQFAEHGGWYHNDLWQENVRVPLVIWSPDLDPGRVDHMVQTIDVAPTLAQLADVEPAPSWVGRDISDLDDDDIGPPIITGGDSDYALVEPSSGLKLIRMGGAEPMLFDLDDDPSEQHDLAASRPSDIERLETMLDTQLAAQDTYGAQFRTQ